MQFTVLYVTGRSFVDNVIAGFQADIGAADGASGIDNILFACKRKLLPCFDSTAQIIDAACGNITAVRSNDTAGIGKRIACYQNALINPPTIDNIVIIIIHFIDFLILVIIFIFPFGNLFSLVI
jgi:hypothetical protein